MMNMAHMLAGTSKIDTPNGLVLVEINEELNKIIKTHKKGKDINKTDIKLLGLYKDTVKNFTDRTAPDGNLCAYYLKDKINVIYELLELSK